MKKLPGASAADDQLILYSGIPETHRAEQATHNGGFSDARKAPCCVTFARATSRTADKRLRWGGLRLTDHTDPGLQKVALPLFLYLIRSCIESPCFARRPFRSIYLGYRRVK